MQIINTLNLGTWSLRDWATLIKDHNIDSPEIEGVTLARINSINSRYESNKIALRNFFMELPKMESHYCRISSSKKYLEPIWQSKAALFRTYLYYCKGKGVKPLFIKTFHEEFASIN